MRQKREAPERRATRAVCPQRRARSDANRNPPDPIPAGPAVPKPATRFGPQGPTSREFRTFGEFRTLRKSRKSPGKREREGGIRRKNREGPKNDTPEERYVNLPRNSGRSPTSRAKNKKVKSKGFFSPRKGICIGTKESERTHARSKFIFLFDCISLPPPYQISISI